MWKISNVFIIFAAMAIAVPLAVAQYGYSTAPTTVAGLPTIPAIGNVSMPNTILPNVSNTPTANMSHVMTTNAANSISANMSNAMTANMTNSISANALNATASNVPSSIIPNLPSATNQTTTMSSGNVFMPQAGGKFAWQGTGYYEIPSGSKDIPATGMMPGVQYLITNQAFISSVNSWLS
ncbi:MAG: hypothetical protein KGI06_02725 [Candidatus Micrarchaeota archaeon]|nr:hypothetical protein [Candidatus Micrarchaeota archaeon]